MAGRPRLVVLDVDGTLLRSDLRVSPRTRTAVAAVLGAGVEVALASARAPAELASVVTELPGVTLLVALQGAWVGRWGEIEETIAERRLALESARLVTAEAIRRGLTVGWFGPRAWSAVRADPAILRHARVTGLDAVLVGDFAAAGVAPHKVMVLAPDGERERQLDDLASSLPPDCLAFRSGEDYLEVTAAGVDKGSGLRLLLERLGLAPGDVLAFGDGDNDVGLLESAGHAVAMGNATAAARAAAGEVTTSNDEDGVARVLERVFGPERAAGT